MHSCVPPVVPRDGKPMHVEGCLLCFTCFPTTTHQNHGVRRVVMVTIHQFLGLTFVHQSLRGNHWEGEFRGTGSKSFVGGRGKRFVRGRESEIHSRERAGGKRARQPWGYLARHTQVKSIVVFIGVSLAAFAMVVRLGLAHDHLAFVAAHTRGGGESRSNKSTKEGFGCFAIHVPLGHEFGEFGQVGRRGPLGRWGNPIVLFRGGCVHCFLLLDNGENERALYK
jgi:hypothetical protein